MTESFKNHISSGLKGLGLVFSDDILEKLFVYYEMLLEKNKVVNLTAITEEKDVVSKHFVDSLSIIKAYDFKDKNINVIDIGTGAGFPGLVLKIVFPDLKIVLNDSLNKRLVFLNEVIDRLNLKGVRTIHGRAEDIGRDRLYREKYDIAVSRAVAYMPVLSEYCLPLVSVGGSFIAYKSGECDKEIKDAQNAIKILGGHMKSRVNFVLPDTDINRSLVIVSKTRKTPGAYPRKAGRPSSSPLIY